MQQKRDPPPRHVSRCHHEWFQQKSLAVVAFCLAGPRTPSPMQARRSSGPNKTCHWFQQISLSVEVIRLPGPNTPSPPLRHRRSTSPCRSQQNMSPVPTKIFACRSFPSRHACSRPSECRHHLRHHLTVAASLTGGCTSSVASRCGTSCSSTARARVRPCCPCQTPHSHLHSARHLPPTFTLATTSGSDAR